MYLTKDQQEKDDQIIGTKTPRYFIGNYTNSDRLSEDIKAFSVFGDYDELKNVTATGLFSSKYGVFVAPSHYLGIRQGNFEDHSFIADAGELVFHNSGKATIRPEYGNYDGPLGPGAYYYPDAKQLSNITSEEASAVLDYVIAKSQNGGITPLTSEEFYEVISQIRGLENKEDIASGISR